MRLRELPAEPTAIPDALENFVIQHAIARLKGLGVPEAAEPDRNLRTVARLIEALVERDARPLTEHRAISNYLYGTCHDFALLAAGIERQRIRRRSNLSRICTRWSVTRTLIQAGSNLVWVAIEASWATHQKCRHEKRDSGSAASMRCGCREAGRSA